MRSTVGSTRHSWSPANTLDLVFKHVSVLLLPIAYSCLLVPDKPDEKKKPRAKRKNNGTKVPITRSKEDLENKGKKKKRTVEPRPAKKKVLEEANNSKLRRLVEVRVEDCLRRVSKDLGGSEPVSAASPPAAEDASESVAESEVLEVAEAASEPAPAAEEPEPPPDDDGERMELPTAAALDDRSDSGVSSLRSGSGDERSGSRSSALSSSDEKPVWREPAEVRHVHSVQHQSLLMSHPPAPAPPAPAPAPAPYPPPHYSLLPPPVVYQQHVDMLWKQRYTHTHATHLHPAAAEDLLERERAMAHERDRHERHIR